MVSQAAVGRLSYGVNLYYMKGNNIIQQQMVDGRPMNVNTGAIENSGAELDLSWRINSCWQVNGNYSLLHMHNPVVGRPSLSCGSELTISRDDGT